MTTIAVIGSNPRIRLLYASFGLSQASAAAVDTLILLFADKVLFASAQHIALLDAVGTIAFTVASVCFSLLCQHAPSKRIFTVMGFFGLSIPMFLFSSIGTLWMAYTFTAILEALFVLPNALTASHLCRAHPRAEWPSVYGRLGASGSLGSAAGLLLAIGWLAMAPQFEDRGMGERTLFLALGTLAALSAVGAWHATVGLDADQGETGIFKRVSQAISILRIWLRGSCRSIGQVQSGPKAGGSAKSLTEPVLNDTMKMFLPLTALLHVGLGMSFTGTMLYIISDLKAASAITFLVVLTFRLAAYLASNPAGNHLSQLMPLRFQQMAGCWRFIAVVALGLLALLPAGPWGITALLPLVAACGISNGIMGVTGPVSASALVATEKQPTAYLLFIAVSNGGAGVGAWIASIAAPGLGFPALLGISALIFGGALLLWHKL